MSKKFLVLLLVLALVVTLFAGCAVETEQPEEGEEGQEEQEEGVKIAMVTDSGGVNDESFNQSAWEGLQRAEQELKVEVSYVESNDASDYQSNLEQMLDAGNDLIWGIGFMMADDLLDAAAANPDQKYAIIDSSFEETPENVVGVMFKAEQPSFLVGYIAGKMTQTGKVGFVGGVEGFIIDGFDFGFHAGVKYANPDVEVFRQYAGNWDDVAKGKS